NQPNTLIIKAAHINVALRLSGEYIQPLAMDLQKVHRSIAYADAPVHYNLASKGTAFDGVNHPVPFKKAWNHNIKPINKATSKDIAGWRIGCRNLEGMSRAILSSKLQVSIIQVCNRQYPGIM